MRSYSSPQTPRSKYADEFRALPRIVQEKVDGSQLSFELVGHQLVAHSRNQQLTMGQVSKQFKKAVDYMLERKSRMRQGLIYRGEALCSNRQNKIYYTVPPESGFILWEVEFSNPDVSVGFEVSLAMLRKASVDLDLPMAPIHRVLDAGELYEDDDRAEDMAKASFLGGCCAEGVVVKALGTEHRRKWVSPAFLERAEKATVVTAPEKAVAEIARALTTNARYDKAIQHLREAGSLTDSMLDVGPLLKEIHIDLEKEERDYIMESLYSSCLKPIKKEVCKGFAAYYQQQITKPS